MLKNVIIMNSLKKLDNKNKLETQKEGEALKIKITNFTHQSLSFLIETAFLIIMIRLIKIIMIARIMLTVKTIILIIFIIFKLITKIKIKFIIYKPDKNLI